MVDYVKFGEKEYPVSMGFAAMRECEREKGVSVIALLDGAVREDKVDGICYCAYLAIKHGQRQAGEPVTITEDQLSDLFDQPGKFKEIADLMSEQLGKILALPKVVEPNPVEK